MTLSTAYIGANNYQTSVNTDRKILEFLVGAGVSGVTPGSFTATPVAGQHQASVGAAGSRAFLAGKNTPSVQGSYFIWADSPEIINLPVPQANPFIATLVLRDADPQFGTVVGAVGPRIDVVSGTPASSPVPVADAAIDALGVPGGWTRLYDIRINTADTVAVPIGQFTDVRTIVSGRAGDPIICTSTNRPTGYLGLQIFERDTLASGIFTTTWLMTDSVWQSYIPDIYVGPNKLGTLGSTAGNAVIDVKYFRMGKQVHVKGGWFLGSTTSYTGVAGTWALVVPPNLLVPGGDWTPLKLTAVANTYPVLGNFLGSVGGQIVHGQVLAYAGPGTPANSVVFMATLGGPVGGGVLSNFGTYARHDYLMTAAGAGMYFDFTYEIA